jgi:hypothetical protein
MSSGIGGIVAYMDNLQRLLNFLNNLQARKIYYRLEHVRPDTLMVLVTVPGERWEIEFLAEGDTQIEIFYSDKRGVLSGNKANDLLKQLFETHGS